MNSRCREVYASISSTLVSFDSLEGVALILLSNLGTRFCLRGVGCDAPSFQLGLLTLMIRSTELTLVKRRSTWAHLVNLGQPLVKTLLKIPKRPFDPPMLPGTFAAFSKFHLNTSKSPNVKVVYFVEGHNFHVEWRLRFGVEMREKAWSMPRVTIHRCPEICHLGMHFVHKWLRKTPYAICRSCRGMLDLQLSYSNLGALQFNFLEKTTVKQGNPEMILHRNALLRDVAHRQAPDRAPTPLAGPRHRGTAATAGPIAPAPISAPNTMLPRAARPRAERTDPRRPTNDITAVRRP
jgi:hypothetical protein